MMKLKVMEVPCAKCNKPVQARFSEPTLFQGDSVSGVALAHEETVECPHCGITLRFKLASVTGYIFQTAEAKPVEPPSRILTPGNGFRA